MSLNAHSLQHNSTKMLPFAFSIYFTLQIDLFLCHSSALAPSHLSANTHLHLFIEEFHPPFHYIKGEDNVVADAISCLPMKTLEEADRIQPDVDPDCNAKVSSIILDIESPLECFLHHPNLSDEIVFPLDYPL